MIFCLAASSNSPAPFSVCATKKADLIARKDESLTESLANMASLMYLLISMTSQRYRVRNYWALFQYFYHRLLQEYN